MDPTTLSLSSSLASSEPLGPTSVSPALIAVLAGSTGVGKSDVAARLCDSRRGMVVSADSVQAYRNVQIGANKPTSDELRQTPHLLLDVAGCGDEGNDNNTSYPYNAAEWRRDALWSIRRLLRPTAGYDEDDNDNDNDHNTNTTDAPLRPDQKVRREALRVVMEEARHMKGYSIDEPIFPVVVGGTMLYLQWLVHGQPDALKPSPHAAQRAATDLSHYQADGDWEAATQHVLHQGPRHLLQTQINKLAGCDWYRLRRLLEVAYTVQERDKGSPRSGHDNDDDTDTDGNDKGSEDHRLWERLYTGDRTGGLDSRPDEFDVRCFFLCPHDRWQHARIVDERCEDMVRRGLIQETTDLAVTGQLPDAVSKAIGYRQALDYLSRSNAQDNDEAAFLAFLDDFATATRRYARKQMLWFRKDPTFVFVPVDVSQPKAVRGDAAAAELDRLLSLSRGAFDAERLDPESSSAAMRQETERHAKGMKTYQFQRVVFQSGSTALAAAIREADECTRRYQASVLISPPF